MSRRLHEKLRNKTYRDEFAAAHVDVNLAFQIRALRRQRGWSQQDLGRRLGRKPGREQPGVSRLEMPGHGYTLTTLKRVASAFDVALMVRFVPFSELTRWAENLKSESHYAASFEDEARFWADNDVLESNVLRFDSTMLVRPDIDYTTSAAPNCGDTRRQAYG